MGEFVRNKSTINLLLPSHPRQYEDLCFPRPYCGLTFGSAALVLAWIFLKKNETKWFDYQASLICWSFTQDTFDSGCIFVFLYHTLYSKYSVLSIACLGIRFAVWFTIPDTCKSHSFCANLCSFSLVQIRNSSNDWFSRAVLSKRF